MFSCLAFLLSLPFVFAFQAPQEFFKTHYEKAEQLRRAGNVAGAEAEFRAMLAVAYVKLGETASARGNYAVAVNAFESAVANKNESNETLIELAIAYFHLEQYDKALATLNKAIARDPADSPSHHMLGKTWFMLGEFDKSIVEFQTVLQNDPKNYDVEYTLGLAYLKRRDLPSAQRIYNQMIQQLGDKPQLRVLIGRGYRETGFLGEAIEQFKLAAALDPHFPRVHFYLGLTLLLKEGAASIGEAEKEFQIELNAHPDEFFANYYMGIVSVVERKWDPAVGYLEKASRIQPENPDPWFFLGQARAGLEQHDKAIDAFQKSIALNTDVRHNDFQVANAHFRLGQSLKKVGKSTEADQELKIAADMKAQAFKHDEARVDALNATQGNKLSELVAPEGMIADAPERDAKTREALKQEELYYRNIVAAAHNNLGLLGAERADFAAAFVEFQKAKLWDPDFQGIDMNLGLAAYKAGRYSDVIPALENEIRLHPDSVSAKQLLGLSYFATESWAKAAAMLKDVVSARPSDTVIYFPLTLSLLNDKRPDEANQYIQQMVAQGASPQLHILLGRAAFDQGDNDKALEELEAAITLDAKALLAHFYSGIVYLKLGKLPDAAREFEAEIRLNPNDIQAKYDLAYVTLAGQETQRGIALMRDVVATRPDFADARYELGKALLQTGDVKDSIANLEIAEKLDPGGAHIHYQLGRAYLAAGRKVEANRQLEVSKQLKDKERGQANP